MGGGGGPRDSDRGRRPRRAGERLRRRSSAAAGDAGCPRSADDHRGDAAPRIFGAEDSKVPGGKFAARVQAGDGMTTRKTGIAPMLSVRQGAKALEFYKAAFGAAELFKIESPDGHVVAQLAVDGA